MQCLAALCVELVAIDIKGLFYRSKYSAGELQRLRRRLNITHQQKFIPAESRDQIVFSHHTRQLFGDMQQ